MNGSEELHTAEENQDGDQHEAEQQEVQQQEVEQQKIAESILSIIGKIKKDRNRACLQNIHTFAKRRNINITARGRQKGNWQFDYAQYFSG